MSVSRNIKKLEALAPVIDLKSVAVSRRTHPSQVSYHAEFGRSRLNNFGVGSVINFWVLPIVGRFAFSISGNFSVYVFFFRYQFFPEMESVVFFLLVVGKTENKKHRIRNT